MAEKRENWGSRIGFLLTAIGCAVGLGNLWRFPFVCYKNGGGAFLIPYIIATIVIAIPLVIFEMSLGQITKKATPSAFAKFNKKFEWLGWWPSLITTFGIGFYYMVILAWVLNYFFFSFSLKWGTDTKSFFYNKFLGLSSNIWQIGSIQWPIFLGSAFLWFLTAFIVYKGIQSGLEKANKFLMPTLFFLTIVFVLWSITFKGASIGLKHYFIPDFAKLKNPDVWLEAAKQVFFSVGIGFGLMTTLASYLPENSDVTTNAIVTAVSDGLYAIVASIAIFATLGYMAFKTGLPIDKVMKAGPGLAFVVYPQAINLIPSGAKIFGAIFFLLLFIAGFSSIISMFEVFVAAISDKFNISRTKTSFAIALIGTIGSALFATKGGLYWLDTIDHFMLSSVLFIVYLEIIFLLVFIGIPKLKEFLDSVKPNNLVNKWALFSSSYILPGFLGYLLFTDITNDIKAPYGGYPVNSILVSIGFAIMLLGIALWLSKKKIEE